MTWQEELKNNVRSVGELIDLGYASEDKRAQYEAIAEQFPISIPRYYLSLIDKADKRDPIRMMCIPSALELDTSGTFDTSGEADNTVVQGLQHKYKRTALMLSTNVCAMYCRHCFRKRLVGVSDDETMAMIDDITAYITEHPEIDNILVSGGDALLNSNRVLGRLLEELSQIDHLKFIRFGTRTPVVFPARITEDRELLQLLHTYGEKKTIYIVTQFNHPKELTRQSRKAIELLKRCGLVISNQTVLLRGVNDSAETLARLMNGLTAAGVIPYYLFQCRPVTAVKTQFQVPFLEAIDIVETAKGRLNGHAKRFKYAMSHPTGKIEIIGRAGENKMVFKYHQPKYEKDIGRLFAVDVAPDQAWLGDIPQQQ